MRQIRTLESWSHPACPRALGALAGLSALLFALLAPGTAGAEAVTVSPGELDREVEAASACPSFSWSQEPGAQGYQLAVFRIADDEEPELLLDHVVEGSATAWQPAREACLEPGGRYAWTVRALGAADAAEGSADWAPARRFTVSAAPADEEVASALETLRRWTASRGEPAPAAVPSRPSAAGPDRAAIRAPLRADERAVEQRPEAPLATGVAAVRGEIPDPAGNTFGLLGISHSPEGAGVVARNESSGADLVLDGEAAGATDTLLREDSLDRPAAGASSFDFRNSGAGAMTVRVDGVDVVTTETDRDTLGDLSCPAGQIAKRGAGGWACAPDDDTLPALPCSAGQIPRFVAGAWTCDADADALAALLCAPGQIAKVDPAGEWTCAPDDDALGALACPDGQVAKRVAGAWACAPDDTGSATIWASYPEGTDVRVFNAEGNRVGIGNRPIQPVGSLPSEDGALTVVHSAALPLTSEYYLTMDGKGVQARSRPGLFDPQQDAPLLLNRYGGGVAIGKETAPTRAALEAQGSVGNTMATFQRSAGGQGLALVGDWPGLYANAYFANGVKTMSGSGYSQLVNFEQNDGAIVFQTSTAPNTVADVPAATIAERLRISKEGALLSSLTQNQFNLAPLAVISLTYQFQSDGGGGLIITPTKQLIRSTVPVTITPQNVSETVVRLLVQVSAPGNAELVPVFGLNSATGMWAEALDIRPVSSTQFNVQLISGVSLVNVSWNLQLVVYGLN